MKANRGMRGKIARSAVLLLALVVSMGSKSYKLGRDAERVGNYDEAVTQYTRALAEKPSDLSARRGLERAKFRASAAHALRASQLYAKGAVTESLDEMRIALALNPTDSLLQEQVQKIEQAVKEHGEAAARATLAMLKEQAREKPLAGLKLAPEADRPASFLFRDASLYDVLVSLGRMAGVNVLFDSGFQDRRYSLDLKDTTFTEALISVCNSTQHFYRVQPGNVLTIIPDTPAKRREYEQQIGKTFYLSNADLKETVDLLRIVLGARRIAPHTSTNALTLVDTPEKIAAAERIINTIDRARAELVVELELLEVNRAKMDQYGIQIGSPDGSGGFGGVSTAYIPNDVEPGQPVYGSNVTIVNLPGAYLTLLRTDSDTRLLANPTIRSSEGQAAQAQFGDRVPIPITTFTPLATGGVAQQPVTTFEYQNIGVNINIVSRLHHNDEISLILKIQLDNISGTGFGGLPTFGNRAVDTALRLRNGETTLLAGLIRDEERKSLTGIPGLADIPVLGRIFATNQKTIQETDVVLTLTPRIIRRADLSLEELRSFVIEGGAAGGFLYEAPVPLPRQPEAPPERPKN